jgi:hypothetical protein
MPNSQTSSLSNYVRGRDGVVEALAILVELIDPVIESFATLA